MYNELAAQRQRRVTEAWNSLNEALSFLNAAISEEYEQVELAALGLIADMVTEAMEGCLGFIRDVSDEQKADEFLYGKM